MFFEETLLTAFNPGTYDNFGRSVGISKSTIAAGAILEDSDTTGVNPADLANGSSNDLTENSGAAYAFYDDKIFWNSFE